MWCRVLCVRRANQAGVSLGTLRGSVAACSDVVHAVRWPDPNSTTRCSMRWGSSSASVRPELVKVSQSDGVTTLCMNNPKRLNGWTKAMMDTVFASMNAAAKDETTTAVVLTGADPYYCAGVNLSDTIRPTHPATLFKMIETQNRELFDFFIFFPKPVVVAVNGPAIGASVTSATLCDAIVASEKATFSTPFARLGIPPEGCSSVNFARLMGEGNAERMLGPEGWVPTAQEAAEVGLITKVVPHDQLLLEAQALAKELGEQCSSGKKQRALQEAGLAEAMADVNARESYDLAAAFLSRPFLDAQHDFLKSKGKAQPAMVFKVLSLLHPFWSLLLPKKP